MGGFIPPSDLTSLEHVTNAWNQCPKGCVPMLIGDLNVNLDAPWDKRDETIVKQVDNMDLVCMVCQFMHRRRRRVQGRWTWRWMQRRGDLSPPSPTTFWHRNHASGNFGTSHYDCLAIMIQIIGQLSLNSTQGRRGKCGCIGNGIIVSQFGSPRSRKGPRTSDGKG